MSIIVKQLLINHLLINLPKEIIDIIKDYLFYNIIYKTINHKKNILTLIDNSSNKNNQRLFETHGIYLINIVDNKRNIKFNCGFCNKCGDYLYSFEMTYNVCNC